MDLWSSIEQAVQAATESPFTLSGREPVGGGCINETFRIEGGGQSYFVKLHRAGAVDMFEAEAAGLAEMAAAHAVRVPRPVCTGEARGGSFLVMEYIGFGGGRGGALLGRQLAQLHRRTSQSYGWSRANTIGSTPQINTPSHDWVAFWRQHRLGFQLRLAAEKGHGGRLQRLGERLVVGLDALFKDYRPVASALHGDLWGGNWGVDARGQPVLFDPAFYYGDREADLAMTELFGGFGDGFYAAYEEAYPLDPGYGVRKTLYNTYHILNHLNLFGGGYGTQAERMIASVLAELGIPSA